MMRRLDTPAQTLFNSRDDPPRIRPRAIVWLDPAQIDFVSEVADAARIEVIAAGSPARGQANTVAAALRAKTVDDLRNALSAGVDDESLVWIAASGAFGSDPADVRALQAAAARGVKLISSEPLPASVEQLAMREWSDVAATVFADTGGGIPLTPRTRATDAWTEAWQSLLAVQPDIDPIAGAARFAIIDTACRSGHGTLGALLVNAIDVVVGLMGEPESVSASYVPEVWSAARTAGVRVAPESLAGLRGDLALILDFPDGRAASIAASDRAPSSVFRAVLHTIHGRIDLDDDGFVWRASASPTQTDVHRTPEAARGVGPRQVAADIRRTLAPAIVPPLDSRLVLSVAQAALLSARTHGPARPGVFLSMLPQR